MATWADRRARSGLPGPRSFALRRGAWVPWAALLLTACGGGEGGKRDPRLALLPCDSLSAWVEERRPVVLFDVRPDSLFEAARIPDSIRARGQAFAALRDLLPPGLDVPLVFVSEDGRRPLGAPDRDAESAGYTRVLWLEGGLEAWRAKGLPVVGSRTLPG